MGPESEEGRERLFFALWGLESWKRTKWWRHRQLEGLDHFKSSFFTHTSGVWDGLANVSTWPLGHGVARVAELEAQAQRASERSLRAGQKLHGHFYPHLRSHVASLPYTLYVRKKSGNIDPTQWKEGRIFVVMLKLPSKEPGVLISCLTPLTCCVTLG